VLVREAGRLEAAFSYSPAYYHFDQGATNYMALGPQNSRGFRGLKVWLALRQAGRAGFERMIGDDIRLSRELHAGVQRHPELEAFTQGLSVNTFRYVPEDLKRQPARDETYLDRLNEAVLERIQRSGEAFVSNAVVDGRYLLRACIVNFRTDRPRRRRPSAHRGADRSRGRCRTAEPGADNRLTATRPPEAIREARSRAGGPETKTWRSARKACIDAPVLCGAIPRCRESP
jgi:glutamate/tyrosine decarboxylase-like PLP-dependent enzyme